MTDPPSDNPSPNHTMKAGHLFRQLKFTITVEQLAELFQHLLMTSTDSRLRYRTARLAAALRAAKNAILIGFVVLSIPTLLDRAVFRQPELIAAITTVLWIGGHLALRAPLKGYMNAVAFREAWVIARRSYWQHCKETLAWIDSEGFISDNQRWRTCVSWTGVASVESLPIGVVIKASRLIGWIVPAHVFADRAEQDTFAAIIRDRQDACGASPQGQIAHLLRDSHVSCQSCHYDLKGCTGDVCPECGEILDLELIFRSMSWADIERLGAS